MENVEQYLVKVWKKFPENCKIINFDDLRVYMYRMFGKELNELPPTSNTMKLHILRAFYATYSQINCFYNKDLFYIDPTKFGFIVKDDLLLPRRIEYLYHRLMSWCQTVPVGYVAENHVAVFQWVFLVAHFANV